MRCAQLRLALPGDCGPCCDAWWPACPQPACQLPDRSLPIKVPELEAASVSGPAGKLLAHAQTESRVVGRCVCRTRQEMWCGQTTTRRSSMSPRTSWTAPSRSGGNLQPCILSSGSWLQAVLRMLSPTACNSFGAGCLGCGDCCLTVVPCLHAWLTLPCFCRSGGTRWAAILNRTSWCTTRRMTPSTSASAARAASATSSSARVRALRIMHGLAAQGCRRTAHAWRAEPP